jgi:hypothetical protein
LFTGCQYRKERKSEKTDNANIQLDDWWFNSGRIWEFFSSPLHPDKLWGPPSLLSNGYHGFFPCGKSGLGMKLTTHLHLVPRSRMHGAIPPLPNTPPWHGAQLKKKAWGQLHLYLYL